ncbi:MAG TPA: CRTAC1 family protein [Thermoanaerobaculia bacterium]|nr:CRTAC1 family protein [Thermoanaerobaculia bacterium]
MGSLRAVLLLLLLASPAEAQLRFREVSQPWGLSFRHHHGGSGQFYMPETMGAGVAVFDYDGDGDPDVFYLDSGAMRGYQGETPRSVLLRNEGAGKFVDVTERSGIRVTSYGMGTTAGDVDGDSDLDLYVSAFGPDQLFRNNGDGSFTEVTAQAGLGNPLWGTSAAFADTDADGDLDLYVTNYVDFSYEKNPICGNQRLGLRSYCHPDVFNGVPDRFYRNRGDGTFEDATAAAGFAPDAGNGLGVIFGDLDWDGDQDLYVANDMTPAFLFENKGNGKFEEIGLLSGTALSDLGKPEAGMGVDFGDIDGNGFQDIIKTHLDLQTNALYSNQGSLLFIDARYTSKLAEPSMYMVGFGTAFADLDQDGDLDNVIANGHIIHNVELFGTGTTYKQRNQLFENTGKGVFREIKDGGIDVVRSSRGLAAGDLDLDGDLDLVITNSDDLSEVYENVTSPAGGWLQVDLADLRGGGKNTAAIGARVELEAGGRKQVRETRTGASYLSQSALTLHFGMGTAAQADRLTIRWPDGKVQVLRNLPQGRRIVVVQ